MEIRRKVKNVVYKYSEPERLVREATSNDPWGPTSTVMSEIADMTFDNYHFEEIMPIIWKRLNDKGKNWRHVYKCLVLLDYLIKCGNERVATLCISNIHPIETLKDFQYFEEHKDHGLCVREKSKALVTLLKDDEMLKLERNKGQKVKEKFQGGKSALGSDQRRRPGDLGREIRKQFDRGQRFPKPTMKLNFDGKDDEDEDFKRAIALSKEEHEESMKRKQEEERLEGIKLKMAMEQSKKEEEALSVLRPPPKNNSARMSVDLMGIANLDEPVKKTLVKMSESSRAGDNRNEFDDLSDLNSNDPWGSPSVQNVTSNISMEFDLWQTNDVTPVGNTSTANTVWTNQFTEPKTSILDDLFGDDKPNAEFDNSWELDNKFSSITTNAEKENKLFDDWIEPTSDKFHSSNKMAGSLASLTDIGLGSHDGKMQHSSSVMNLAPSRQKKTPQEFLGDNANLVNLENLLPTPKAASKNQFGMQSGMHSNPFNSNTVQIKKPMNTMAVSGGHHNNMFASSGNINNSNFNANFGSFPQLPQPIIPNSQSQYQQGFPVTTNYPYNGNSVWVQQPTFAPSQQWAAPSTNVSSNPFFN